MGQERYSRSVAFAVDSIEQYLKKLGISLVAESNGIYNPDMGCAL